MADLIWGPMNATRNPMRISLPVIFLFLLSLTSFAQSEKRISVLFYNVENLFDFKNDSLTDDDEFTPEGERHWTYQRFQKKLDNTAKSLLAAGGWDVPDLIGLCEIENRYVLDRLLADTPLKNLNYKIIHKESPDSRGIDVALLYNPSTFHPISYNHFPMLNKDGSIIASREILYVSGTFNDSDTLHYFVNHWPSRYGGLLETRDSRQRAAILLRTKVDSLFALNPDALIVIMGDFNDQPNDESLAVHLNAKLSIEDPAPANLYNLSADWQEKEPGTLKYQAQWSVFDQVIVSGELLRANSGLHTKAGWASIEVPSFLLETDDRYGGMKPKRTFIGMRYNGGFSDHFPVKLLINVR